MPAGPDIFSLRERRTGSLKVITFVFRPKSSEEQKNVITSADVQFSAQGQVKSKKKVFTPSDCFFIRIPRLHHESFLHLSAGGRGRPWAFAPPKKAKLRHCFWCGLKNRGVITGCSLSGLRAGKLLGKKFFLANAFFGITGFSDLANSLGK